MTKAEKLFRIKIALEQINLVFSALCRETRGGEISEEARDIIRRIVLFENKLNKGAKQ